MHINYITGNILTTTPITKTLDFSTKTLNIRLKNDVFNLQYSKYSILFAPNNTVKY